MKKLITIDDLTRMHPLWQEENKTVGFVPTMGALHDGHLTLMLEAKQQCDVVIASIFVNPKQFGPNEDFAKYPRTLSDDVEKLERVGVDAVFIPNASEMYPDGFATVIANNRMAADLCGKSRPGHFDGVLTVVNKLLNLTRAHRAYFGKKDYQQWRLIEKMVSDLAMPVTIVGCEIVREQDGLAMSSRNRYLSVDERRDAARIYAALLKGQTKFTQGERSVEGLRQLFRDDLADIAAMEVDYVEIRKQADLAAYDGEIIGPAVMAVAVRLGTTRLIDNIELKI